MPSKKKTATVPCPPCPPTTTMIIEPAVVIPEPSAPKRRGKKPTSSLKNPLPPPAEVKPVIAVKPPVFIEDEEEEEYEEEEEEHEEEEEEESPIVVKQLRSPQKPKKEEITICSLLAGYGFKSIAFMKKDNKVIAVKILTTKGEHALVRLSDGEKTNIYHSNESNVSTVYLLTDSRSWSGLPQSIKTGMVRSTQPSVCGVVMECNGDACAYWKDSNEELIFQCAEKSSAALVAYPVVRWSEIEADAESVLLHIHDNTMKLLSYSRHMNDTATLELASRIEKYSFPIFLREVVDVQKKVFSKLEAELTELNKLSDYYRGMKKMSPDCAELYQRVQVNLRLYNEMYIKLLQLGQQVSSPEVYDMFLNLTTDLENAYNYSLSVEPIIGYVLDE